MSACPPDSSADSKLLERVQAKATALVRGLKGQNSEDRRRQLGLMTLEERRERGDMIEVFKILKGLTRIDPAEFWEVRDARNGIRLVKEFATNGKRQRKNFFSYRVIQKWNLLPTEVKTAPSLDCFKNRLDAKIMENSMSRAGLPYGLDGLKPRAPLPGCATGKKREEKKKKTKKERMRKRKKEKRKKEKKKESWSLNQPPEGPCGDHKNTPNGAKNPKN